MSPDDIAALVGRYLDAYNRQDVEGMLPLLHPEVMFRNIVAGEVTASACGIEAFAALARQSLPLFSVRRQTLASLEVLGSSALAEIRFEAVAAQDLPSGLRAGEVLRLEGRSEFEFRDGQIAGLTDIS